LLEAPQPPRIRGELRRQHFDRHLAGRAGVLAEADLAYEGGSMGQDSME
jgi:hypothetical protein